MTDIIAKIKQYAKLMAEAEELEEEFHKKLLPIAERYAHHRLRYWQQHPDHKQLKYEAVWHDFMRTARYIERMHASEDSITLTFEDYDSCEYDIVLPLAAITATEEELIELAHASAQEQIDKYATSYAKKQQTKEDEERAQFERLAAKYGKANA